jgi:hypothetical protein
MTEKEYSIKVPIIPENAKELISKYKTWKFQRKFISFIKNVEYDGEYEEDYAASIHCNKSVLRSIEEGNRLIFDKKTYLSSKYELINVKNIFLNCEYKESNEVFIDYQPENNELLILRWYFHDGNLRWSIETMQKNWGGVYFDTCLYHLHVESEHCDSFDQFKTLLINSEWISLLMNTFCNNSYNFKNILKKEILITRKFVYKPIEEYKIFSPKLDGVRHPFIIFQKDIYFHNLAKSITLKNQINNIQLFFGCAELVNGKFYIIDILKIYGPFGEYCDVPILDALKIIEILKNNPLVNTNQFFTNEIEARLIGKGEMYDGALAFGQISILKLKNSITIDLLVKSNNLSFKNGESFTEHFPKYTINYKEYREKKKIPNVLEFLVDLEKCEISFLKIRYDKTEANQINDFIVMTG